MFLLVILTELVRITAVHLRHWLVPRCLWTTMAATDDESSGGAAAGDGSTEKKLFECVICYQFPINYVYTCKTCGEVYCQLCTMTLGKFDINSRNAHHPACCVCRRGELYRSRFAEKIKEQLMSGYKMDCRYCGKKKALCYPTAVKMHDARCMKRLVLCPDARCKHQPMPMEKLLKEHAELPISECGVRTLKPWKKDRTGAHVFKFHLHDYVISSVDYGFEKDNKRAFFVNDPNEASTDLQEAGIYLRVLRMGTSGEWHFNFFSYLSEEEARKYTVELTIFKPAAKTKEEEEASPRRPPLFPLRRTPSPPPGGNGERCTPSCSKPEFLRIVGHEYIALDTTYFTLTSRPHPQYTRFKRSYYLENYPPVWTRTSCRLQPDQVKYRNFLTDRDMEKIMNPCRSNRHYKVNMLVRISKRA